MDGRPILSCLALAAECDGATIETAEGIADANHPLIELGMDPTKVALINHCGCANEKEYMLMTSTMLT